MTIYFHQNDLPDNLILKGAIAIDTETMGLKTWRDRLCLIQISNGNGDAHLIKIISDERSQLIHKNLIKVLKDEKVLKIFHFARFDLAALSHYICTVKGPVWCTKIASKLSRTYTDRHGLKDLCKELLLIEISKEQQSSNWGGLNISKKQKEYAANDVLYLHKIKENLETILIQENRLELAKKIFDFLKIRVELDLQGFNDMDIFAH
jgi:ribonuclease D